MKSVMSHDFSRVPHADIPRSKFRRDHGYKTTFDAGYLVPVYVDEVLPGDTFTMDMAAFGRLATPIHPLLDNLYLDTFFFAVPLRLLWDHWQAFNGEQVTPGASTDYLVPQVSIPVGGIPVGSLGDYFGLPTGVPIDPVNAFHFRAYNLIWNEWFRDENLQSPAVVNMGDGPDNPNDYVLRRRGKRHDYFTSCLPWPQKGDSVSLPLGGNVPIATQAAQNGIVTVKGADGQARSLNAGQTYVNLGPLDASDKPLYADMTASTAATINQLRQAFAIQRLFERDARGGSRYTEILRSHFGVTSPDARLQRPEYLGGGSTPISMSAVPQTSDTVVGSPQGNLAAYGTVSLNRHGFNKSFTEHCVIIGMVSVRADLTYQQGVDRMWSRQGRFDYYWPALSHIGEQAVLSREIYADGTAADDDVFGYQERYAEYRYKPSKITGKMRSSDPQSLDVWHLSQDFATRPVLNAAFIEENPPLDRVIAVPDEPHFLLDCYFKLTCARPMPLYGVPGLIDHF